MQLWLTIHHAFSVCVDDAFKILAFTSFTNKICGQEEGHALNMCESLARRKMRIILTYTHRFSDSSCDLEEGTCRNGYRKTLNRGDDARCCAGLIGWIQKQYVNVYNVSRENNQGIEDVIRITEV